MALVTGCWASSGQAAAGCAMLEQQLRACMDAPVRAAVSLTDICCCGLLTRSALPYNSVRHKQRRTTSTTTWDACIPRLSGHTRKIEAHLNDGRLLGYAGQETALKWLGYQERYSAGQSSIVAHRQMGEKMKSVKAVIPSKEMLPPIRHIVHMLHKAKDWLYLHVLVSAPRSRIESPAIPPNYSRVKSSHPIFLHRCSLLLSA